jgi:hypothetical protein
MDLQPGYYWVDNGDNEPEPALWDGKGWALLGVANPIEVPKLLSPEPIIFHRPAPAIAASPVSRRIMDSWQRH